MNQHRSGVLRMIAQVVRRQARWTEQIRCHDDDASVDEWACLVVHHLLPRLLPLAQSDHTSLNTQGVQ